MQCCKGLILLAFLALAGCRASHLEAMWSDAPVLGLDDILAPTSASKSLAIHQLERRIEGGRTGSDAWCASKLRIAALELELASADRAERAAREVLATAPAASPEAQSIAGLLLGRALVASGKSTEARAAFEAAKRLAPNSRLASTIADDLAAVSNFEPTRATRVDLISRATWGASPGKADRMDPMGTPTRITIHHSAVFCTESPKRIFEIARIFQRTHIEDRGWGDIGYHWLIDRTGRVLEGRDMRYQGAHAGNNASNRHNIGICLLGNFEPGHAERAQKPSAAQLDALEGLVRTLSTAWNIPTHQIFTHREIHPHGVGATACPGVWLSPFVESMRTRLRQEWTAATH
ncbi:MAG: N-acetylmuramoyl-L-alanine amidase [Planctomycetes bacterium]|nr:N-acetylmuramoyl-L-alanine amidase [Planctomycetota bacterium]